MKANEHGKTLIMLNQGCVVDGEYHSYPGRNKSGNWHNVTQANGRTYIDGWELKNGKWRRTLAALWYLLV